MTMFELHEIDQYKRAKQNNLLSATDRESAFVEQLNSYDHEVGRLIVFKGQLTHNSLLTPYAMDAAMPVHYLYHNFYTESLVMLRKITTDPTLGIPMLM